MSSRDKDVGAGPSQPMSVEEQARRANLKFWRFGDDLSGSDEEAEATDHDEVDEEAQAADQEDDEESEYEEEAEDGDDDGSSNGDEEAEASHGGERVDGDGASPPARKKKNKAERQERTLPKLGTNREEVTLVKLGGQPLEPAKLAAGYGQQLRCIVR